MKGIIIIQLLPILGIFLYFIDEAASHIYFTKLMNEWVKTMQTEVLEKSMVYYYEDSIDQLHYLNDCNDINDYSQMDALESDDATLYIYSCGDPMSVEYQLILRDDSI